MDLPATHIVARVLVSAYLFAYAWVCLASMTAQVYVGSLNGSKHVKQSLD